jgi:hypothetical protein
VSGSPGLVLGAVALLEPSFQILGPRSKSQGQVFAFEDLTELPLGLAHLRFTCRLLAQQTILVAGRLAPRPQFKFLSTTQPELGMHSPAPGADSLLGLLINFLDPSGHLLGLLAYFLGLLIFLLDPLANIPEPSPRQLSPRQPTGCLRGCNDRYTPIKPSRQTYNPEAWPLQSESDIYLILRRRLTMDTAMAHLPSEVGPSSGKTSQSSRSCPCSRSAPTMHSKRCSSRSTLSKTTAVCNSGACRSHCGALE